MTAAAAQMWSQIKGSWPGRGHLVYDANH